MCGPSCGDLDRPPSRQNMSLIAIVELVVMLCVGIVCGLDLVNLIDTTNIWDFWPILRAIRDAFVVAGLVLVLVGLFCSISQYQIRSGILCFCIGTIISVVMTIFGISKHDTGQSLFYNICYIIFMIFLAWILWRQSGHL